MQKNIEFEIAEITPVKEPFEAVFSVPGSKSYSIRALVIDYLCEKDIDIDNLLDSDDTRAMKNCVLALKNKSGDIESGESGLTARFMTALASITGGSQIITGGPSLLKRPVDDLVDALRQLGADIEYTRKEGFLPVRVVSSELKGGKVSLSGKTSSQYLSALLLIAPTLTKGLVIEVNGEQISKPYIDMTLSIMRSFGISVKNEDYKKYEVSPQNYEAKDYIVEGDYSSAAYFFAAAALTGSKATVKNLNPESKQADRKFLDVLSAMGAKVSVSDDEISVSGQDVKPIHIDMSDCPDQAMTAAVLAAYADKESVIKGVKSLRVKETERVIALENELAKMGIKTSSTEDVLTIRGDKPLGANIYTYDDHRIAMSFALAGLRTPGINIMHPKVVNKTFPGFWDELKKITKVQFSKKKASNILLMGMRGSGKTTVGGLLAEKLGKKFIDMDVYLEMKHGKKVRDLVLDNGWEHFRKLESEACEQVSKEKDAVISSGGGIVLDQDNMNLFRRDSVFLLLRANPAILSSRIRTDKNRPELTTQPTLLGELDQVWEKRKDKYHANADLIIDTTADSPEYIVNEIMDKLVL